CRLPIADCRLPIADCRLPIADCRLPMNRAFALFPCREIICAALRADEPRLRRYFGKLSALCFAVRLKKERVE
ncbi:MAG: hypothetical protein GXY61_02630, partial [Lentisphaerae bacterium]|nr:hypothetical protein [Lentisphaerota bacterium]